MKQHSSHFRKIAVCPAPNLKPEEREFVVDSGASMAYISKKDLSDAEMDTLTTSRSPTDGLQQSMVKWQTIEEATVHVRELEIFLTMKVLEDTPAALSLGKLCDEKRIFLWMDQWSKTTSHFKRDSDTIQHGELRSNRGSLILSTSSSSSLPSSTSMTLSRQEIDHSTSSPSSFYLTTHDIFNCVERKCG